MERKKHTNLSQIVERGKRR